MFLKGLIRRLIFLSKETINLEKGLLKVQHYVNGIVEQDDDLFIFYFNYFLDLMVVKIVS